MPTQPYKNKEGKRIPGTTTVIGKSLGWNKEQLMFWANRVGREMGISHREISQAAADAGTIGHYLIECDIKGTTPDTSQYPPELVDKAETCFLNYLHWKQSMNFELIESEVSLVSEEYQYGATIDCIARINGKPSLFDWKTSSGVYADYVIQVEAYRHAWEENHPDMALTGGIYLLRIDKENASWAFHYWNSVPAAFEAFKHLRALYDLERVLKKVA